MKRLLVISTISFIITTLVCIYADDKFVTAFFSVVTVIFAISLILALTTRRHIFFFTSVIVGFSVFSFSLFLFCHTPKVDNAVKFDGFTGEVTAQITTIESNEYYSELYVKTSSIGDIPAKVKINVSISKGSLKFKEGDFIELHGNLHTNFSSTLNYNEQKIHASQNTFLLMDAESVTLSDLKPNAFRNFIFNLRQSSINEFSILDNSGLITALTIGERNLLEPEIKADFQKLGLQHALAVSGMHLSILVMSLYVFLQRYSVGKYPLSIICTCITIFYMALTGFSYSIVRAGIMMITYFMSLLIRCINDSLTTLFTSALIILILNPWSVTDVGFQLSFFATLGILTFAKPFIKMVENLKFFNSPLPDKKFKSFECKILRKCIKSVFISFGTTMSATLSTIPLILVYYNSITPLAFIANVTVIYMINLLLIFSAIYLIISKTPLVFIAKIICNLLSNSTLFLTRCLSRIMPNPLQFTPETSQKIAFICMIILLTFFLFYKNYKSIIYLTLAFTLAVTVTLNIVRLKSNDEVYITFSTSKSCCDTIVETTSGKTLLSVVDKNISTKALNRMINFRNAYSLDTVVLFLNDTSPIEKLSAILKNCEVEKLILVPLEGGIKARDHYMLQELYQSEIEYVRHKEYMVNDYISFNKVSQKYIMVTVNQGEKDLILIHSINGQSYPSRQRVESANGVILLGMENYCPNYYVDFYLCNLPQKLIKRRNVTNTDKFNFAFIKISDKTTIYNIY